LIRKLEQQLHTFSFFTESSQQQTFHTNITKKQV